MNDSEYLVRKLSAMVRVVDLDDNGDPVMQHVGFNTADGTPLFKPATKLRHLSRGTALPENVAEGEIDRLLGDNAIVERARYDAESAARAADRRAEETTSKKQPKFDLGKLDEYETAALVDLWKATPPSVKATLARVGTDASLAARVLEVEKAATKGDPRSSLVKALDKVIAGAGQ